ncbi:hypothetical protein U0C82_08185 [Fulvimarina sp. 2208YS6-2-32]|uniref:Uncharacterized protein n=1 Tax=Fulvimarina uroteuthidis TaxID=3098149 RepID=A0ABU5I1V5_9HYPH|nr:hypothetical protein [Fulvimarina sp. 2208YS6-2-32]
MLLAEIAAIVAALKYQHVEAFALTAPPLGGSLVLLLYRKVLLA